MNMSDEDTAYSESLRPANDSTAPRRPASWLDETELRRRARRRNAVYCAVAAICMMLFVLLIYLLLERTRWTAGKSASTSAGIHLHSGG